MTGRKHAVVIGWGVSGRSAATWLSREGWDVTVIEDNEAKAAQAERSPVSGGLSVVARPSPELASVLAAKAALVVPSPGVKMGHPALVSASRNGVPIWSEVELAWSELTALRAALPPGSCLLVAVTGTNGKTTVTELVTEMLGASGLRAVAAGNVGYPLLEAVSGLRTGASSAANAGEAPGSGPTVLVAEVSSFQLEFTCTFSPDVSCWLNFSPDHLDWHPSIEHYAAAKAKIWANQKAGSTIVLNADDPAVMRAAGTSAPKGAQIVTFGVVQARPGRLQVDGARDGGPDWGVVGLEGIRGPDGFELPASELPRVFPHDLANTAASLATALAAGATAEGCKQAAKVTTPPRHRVELIARSGGVSWYDDSKATTPASVLAAVRGFSSVVLVAGGRNKGLDLSGLAGAVPPVHAVVAIGENAAEIAGIFGGKADVRTSASMAEAVEAAASLARAGDAVLLSPGCASFDWYSSYAERGDDFAALVRSKLEEVATR